MHKGRVTVMIAVVLLLAALGLWFQLGGSMGKPIVLTAQDVELFVSEMMPPAQQQELASNPERKKMLVEDLRKLFALAQAAQEEGHLDRPQVRSQQEFWTDVQLATAYQRKHPDVQPADDEVAEYHRAHPDEFRDFLETNPRYKSQGAQLEKTKKEYGQLRILADRARNEGIEKERATELRILVQTSQKLAESYMEELNKRIEAEVTDADLDAYYNSNREEFEEIRARHILISTKPDEGGGGEDEKTKKKPLTKDEARSKAQALLDRIRKGEDFAKLAQENSDDDGSQVKGGDLGYFGKGRMVPEFEQAAFMMQPGQVSDLIETEYGFHIIKVEDRRISPFDSKTKQLVASKLKTEKLDQAVARAVQRGRVEIAEDFEVNPKAAPQAQ